MKQGFNVLCQVFVFSGLSEKQVGCPDLWFAETFSTSSLNRWTEFAETWQEARPQRSLSSFCFSGRLKKKTRWPSGLWLGETFPTSSLKPLNGICRNLTWSKNLTSSTKFVFFWPFGFEKQDGRLGLWFAWTFAHIFDFYSETAEQNLPKLDIKQELDILY